MMRVMNSVRAGTENASLTSLSRAADTARMRKAWTPPWRWVFGVATGLSVFSWLQAWRLTLINSRPGMTIPSGKLLVLNLALWFVPALLMPAVAGGRRFPFRATGSAR